MNWFTREEDENAEPMVSVFDFEDWDTGQKMQTTIEIKYNGDYPNLCRGDLKVIMDGKTWEFPDGAMRSGGSCNQDECSGGDWWIASWPVDFPGNRKHFVEEAINDHISKGCCGGCMN